MTVDSSRKFTIFNANWPGATHDSFVLQMSSIWEDFENGRYPSNCFVLGDGGYQCRKWLLTPYRNPRNRSQHRYNNAHKQTRVLIEQVYGRSKKRFSILADKCRVTPEKAAKIVAVCCVLHNIAISRNQLYRARADDTTTAAPVDDDDDEENALPPALHNGMAVRDYVCQTHFD
jgi:hypothetical protein